MLVETRSFGFAVVATRARGISISVKHGWSGLPMEPVDWADPSAVIEIVSRGGAARLPWLNGEA
jgi:hypothetical protein